MSKKQNGAPALSQDLNVARIAAWNYAHDHRHEYITPEHLLLAILSQRQFGNIDGSDTAAQMIGNFINDNIPTIPDNCVYDGPEPSQQFIEVFNEAASKVYYASGSQIGVPHVVSAMEMLYDSYAASVLDALAQGDFAQLLSDLVSSYGTDNPGADNPAQPSTDRGEQRARPSQKATRTDKTKTADGEEWLLYATCLNDHLEGRNPLIGREAELERTLQVLCRKEKNNPLHVGEPGVGKTALAYGLAALINRGEGVPACLRGAKVYSLDMGALIAGTQYRGDFEKRFNDVLKHLVDEGNAILYIDEIHTIVGAGRTDGSAMDASNLLKPYLQDGSVRFMGATTYEEYNKTFSRNKAFARRFEKIDIEEPSTAQAHQIILGLKDRYEAHHNVTYTPDALTYAVDGAAKYITGRCLPDKAIDLIDEAGAWRQLHPDADAAKGETSTVDRALIAEVLARVCHVDILAEDKDDSEALADLSERIRAKIFGQDKAVDQVVEAVQMATAGLIDDNKPMASLLFVGPTGVGKTEVVRVLADELNLPLLRFDMSEYAEKHTVAKLIGSPAGYVGYEDGGLLTDAIRKTPHCVLLFDELEKAHPDIYNILLQVMDYACLTDNKGQKADFRHVIFVMTTNAGAQRARQGNVGFVKGMSAGETMMKSVKQTFKPEFLNRLTDVTIFNDMDEQMASLILDKKLHALQTKLSAKDVTLDLGADARSWLMARAFSVEYGGREVDRVLGSELKPMLMRGILFGALKNGGVAHVCVDTANDKLTLKD